MPYPRPQHHYMHPSTPTWRAAVAIAVVLAFAGASLASAQEIGGTSSEPPSGLTGPALSRAIQQSLAADPAQSSQATQASGPDKRWGHAVLGTIGVNVVFNLVNLAFRPDAREEFKVTPKTWWDNLKYGMIFDDNNFSTNQFGHPYQGNLYFNVGRANGLNYWESGLMSALGSFTWECCGETNRMSINDFFSTTLGGMIVGEVTHRMASLARNPKQGQAGLGGKIAAIVLDPMGAVVNRKANDNPPASVPDYLAANVRLGAVWRGAAGTLDQAKAYPEFEFDFQYGNPFDEDAREPFDSFNGWLRLGGGGGISELILRGRLVGRHVKDSPATAIRFEVNQGFEYISNPAYEFGAQAVYVTFPLRRKLSETTNVTLTSGGFILPLGAISAEYVDVNERSYDYGPGGGGLVALRLNRAGLPILSAAYAVFAINTVNGSGGSHVAQLTVVEGNAPLFRKLGLGASFRLFQRNSFYVTQPDTFTRYPEARVYMIWRLE